MNVGSLARRYAKAVLSIGIEDHSYEKLASELSELGALLENEELADVLSTPTVPLSQRRAIVDELLARLRPSDTVRRTTLLLLEKGRVAALPEIAREFNALVDEHVGRVRAEVTSARRLAPAQVAKLKQTIEQLTGKTVLLSEKTDKDLIAGMVTKVGSVLYDGSARTRLSELQRSLLDN
ncbi:MAG: ATP synthase F1 subunit delta [Myxococcales bacterium]|nr:ATP synthase F1 subunit delta [Myxococcales bacterium]